MEPTQMTAQEALDRMIEPSVEGLPAFTLSWDFRSSGFEDNYAARDEVQRRLGDWLLDQIEFDPEMSQFFAYSDSRDALVAVARLLVWNEPTHSWQDIAEGTLPDLVEFQEEMDRLAEVENPTYDEVVAAIVAEVEREVEMTFQNLGAPTLGDCMADVARRLNHLTGVEG